jgi:CubicO group peptidase (beta-lactamase class C family)/D-alanyl-D-alanine dipeptidase/sugar lactone lactonase YvrE
MLSLPVFSLLLFAVAGRPAPAEETPDILLPGYEALAGQLERLIRHEMDDKDLPAVSIALVDGQRIVWAAGFGWADRQRGVRASADTVYRVGSVSKLFTDLAVMQLVEQNILDLDAPVADYLPEFRPESRFKTPITLRHLMSHRAGLVREPPVGNYFDPGQPSLAETVESLNRTALVYAPGTRTKYSNAGIAVVGYLLQRRLGKPFADCLRQSVLTLLATEHTDFEPKPAIRERLAEGRMWTYDGRNFAAPTFGLGTGPAGNLYSTVVDLSRFLMALFNEGRAPVGRLLKPETLKQMWTAPPDAGGEVRKFGIGFVVGQLDGHLRVGHGGAIYGFATELAALPDQKLGAVVVASKDGANAVTKRVADEALRRLLARWACKQVPDVTWPEPLPPERAKSLVGRYVGDEGAAELTEHDGRLLMRQGEFRLTLSGRGNELIVDDVLASKPRIGRNGPNELVIDGRPYRRLPDERPAGVPGRWRGLIGEYGFDHNTLYILEEHGHLTALIEWFFYYPLKEIGPDEFAFPASGLYQDERLFFQRDEAGRATRVEAAGVRFLRRPAGSPETARIVPIKPIEELRREVSAGGDPPAETGEFRQPDLVELTSLDPTIRLDIRYATNDNFLGTPVYGQPRAFLQRPAAEALVRVQRELKRHGYGLLIHDAYRPWHVTRLFWEATPPAQRMFVADPAKGSRHNRGCAVDLTLCDLADGRPVAMPSAYDEFSPRASPDYPGGTTEERFFREVLRRAMESEGFSINEVEWWHFDYRDWRSYPIMNVSFEELADGTPTAPPRADEPIFAPAAALKIEAENGSGGEGPAWHPELGLLTSGQGNIFQLDRQGRSSVFRRGAGTNGLLFDAEGRLLACEAEGRRVTRTEHGGAVTVLTERYEGRRYNQPNDLTLDSKGRVYFSDPRYGSREGMEIVDDEGRTIEGVYRIDPDGKVTRVLGRELERPNGLLVSADDRFLFVADNNNDTLGGARKLWRFALRADGGLEAGSRKLLYDWQDGRGPDGIKQDRAGRLYVAAGLNKPNPPFEPAKDRKGGIYVLSPEGELASFLPVPRDEVTNCAFGGDDFRTLYVTAGGTLYSIRTAAAGRVVWPVSQ